MEERILLPKADGTKPSQEELEGLFDDLADATLVKGDFITFGFFPNGLERTGPYKASAPYRNMNLYTLLTWFYQCSGRTIEFYEKDGRTFGRKDDGTSFEIRMLEEGFDEALFEGLTAKYSEDGAPEELICCSLPVCVEAG